MGSSLSPAPENRMLRALPLAALLILLGHSLPLTAPPAPKPYDAIDRHALKASPDVETSLAPLARYLVEPATNDKQKARAIYRWITDRIAYDTESFFAHQHPDEAPELTLKRRKALCGGYAMLFKSLCKEAGVKAVVVEGKVKGIGYSESDPSSTGLHGWNSVKLGDEWYLVDATWGAGSINDKSKKFEKRFQEFYFLTPPEALIFTHFPRKENCQLLDEPITEKDFDRQPKASARFFEVGVTPEAFARRLPLQIFPAW
jgi:transglutaminase/protease-like cytokinesis protein 3